MVGAFPAGQWTATPTKLQPGDTVVFFTDGVTEARVGTSFLGREPFETTLESSAKSHPTEMIDSVLEMLSDSGARRSDDVALLALQAR